MVLIIGHRGARNLWPENSLSGFEKTKELGVDGVEFDVHLTRAGELLVMHDAMLDRTSDRMGPIADLPPGEHRRVRLKGDEDEGIPTLRDVLEVYRNSDIQLHVELKADADKLPYQGLEAQTAALLDEMGFRGRAILTSFSLDVLDTLRQVAPDYPTLCSFDRKSMERLGLRSGLLAAAERADVIAIEKSVFAEHWDEIMALLPGERLGAWVPNEEADLAFWLEKPIRQLTTDRPDRALALRRK